MKEAIIGVLTGMQGLGWDESREKPVDRLTALAAAQWRRADAASRASFLCSLGRDLIAFKGASRPDSWAEAVAKLAEALQCRKLKNLSFGDRQRIAAWAVQEFAVDMCPSCLGAKEVPQFDGQEDGYQPMMSCRACSGSGKRRYTDGERAAAMGQSYAEAMNEAHRIIADAQGLAVSTAAAMLERWK